MHFECSCLQIEIDSITNTLCSFGDFGGSFGGNLYQDTFGGSIFVFPHK